MGCRAQFLWTPGGGADLAGGRGRGPDVDASAGEDARTGGACGDPAATVRFTPRRRREFTVTRPKPGFKTEVDQLRAEMSRTGAPAAALVVEIRVRFGVRAREAWRHARGWSLQQAADRVNELGNTRPGEAVAADASLLGKWEKWPGPSGRRPSLAVLQLLADVYGCRLEELLDLEDRRAYPAADLRLLHGEDTPPPAAPSTAPVTAAAALEGGGELVGAVASESAAWAQWAEASNVGDLAMEQVMADIKALARDYLSDDPLAVFKRARRHRDRVFALLEGHQHPRQAAELYAAAGYLCTLLAWMSSDLGKLDDADTQGRAAWLCAELAGHDDLRAWVLSTRSKVAMWDGRMRDAIAHAQRGATYRTTGTVGVLLACQEADAWSQLGAARQARDALNLAAAARQNVQVPDSVGGLLSCPGARHLNYSSAVHLRLGDAATALQEVEHALASPSHSYGTTAQMHIAQATAHLNLGALDGARAALRPVFALPADQRLAPLTSRLREVAAALARSPAADTRAAADLQAEIEAFCLDSVPRHVALSPGPNQR